VACADALVVVVLVEVAKVVVLVVEALVDEVLVNEDVTTTDVVFELDVAGFVDVWPPPPLELHPLSPQTGPPGGV
jgi:hypothetical protein